VAGNLTTSPSIMASPSQPPEEYVERVTIDQRGLHGLEITMFLRPGVTDGSKFCLIHVALPTTYPTASLLFLEEIPDEICSLSVQLSQQLYQWLLIMTKISGCSSQIYNPLTSKTIYTCGVPLPSFNHRTFTLIPNDVLPCRRGALFDAILYKLPVHIDFLNALLSIILPVKAFRKIDTSVQQLRGADRTTFGAMGVLKTFLESVDRWLQKIPGFAAAGIDIANLRELVRRCVGFEMEVLRGKRKGIEVWHNYRSAWPGILNEARRVIDKTKMVFIRTNAKKLHKRDAEDAMKDGEIKDDVLCFGIWEFRGPDYPYFKSSLEDTQETGSKAGTEIPGEVDEVRV
jgi:hypothetical protein